MNESVYNIFILDDHSVVREGVAQTLSRESDMCVCGDAACIDEAFEKLPACKPDVIIIDISLKNSDGIDFLRQLKAKGFIIPSLIFSMHEEPVYIERALNSGARGYFLKSESIRELPTAIRNIIAGKVYLSSDLAEQLIEKRFAFKDNKDPKLLLSNREMQIFECLAIGLRRSQIAEDLHMSVKTVGTHLERIKAKLEISTVQELIRYAISWGKI
jgi:DNA-binding NarL/FixJ family response regulator